MKSKFIILTATLLSISLLAGCGQTETASNAEVQTPETSTESTATAEQTPEPTATPEATEEPHTHNYAEEITTDATCEADGLKTFTCECGDTYTEAIVASGHNYENYVYNDDATYLADGTETATCVCGLTDTRTKEGSKLEYTYTEMNATMYATQTVNVRNLPNTDGEKIGSLSTNQEIIVIGQCNETSWYKFELDGQTAFVSNSYLSTEKVEVQQSTGGGSSSSTASNVPNALTVERNVWHDMGTYKFYISSYRYDRQNAWGMHLNTSEDLWAWVEYSDPNDAAMGAFIKANGCHCGEPTHGGLYPERGSN